MRQCVLDAFLPFTERFEGHTNFLYLDRKNLVSIGYGNLCDPAIPGLLDFRRPDGTKATSDEVRADWERVKATPQYSGRGGGYYRNIAQLRATEASILALVQAELQSFWSILVGNFPDAPDWPADAQLALLSMAWACGANFPSPNARPPWPNFVRAARDRDWVWCAHECHIDDRQIRGTLTLRNDANRRLFFAAATTTTPDQLTHDDGPPPSAA